MDNNARSGNASQDSNGISSTEVLTPALDNIRRTYCVSDHSDLSEAWIPIALAAAFISEYVLPRILATDAIPHPVVSSCTTGLSTDFPLMHNARLTRRFGAAKRRKIGRCAAVC